MVRGGHVQKKILLLLLGSLALGLSRSPDRSIRIIKEIGREWQKINRRQLYRSVKSLYDSKLIKKETDKKGNISFVLTGKGRKKALSFQLFSMEIKKPATWDSQWRLVVFDIPEHQKNKREIFRMHLRNLLFFELQKSVFVHPYDCRKEIDNITDHYQLGRYVRFIVANTIDNEVQLKTHFEI